MKALAFTHLKIIKKPKAEDSLPTPFELPRNYPQDVMDELKENRLSGRARAKFIASIYMLSSLQIQILANNIRVQSRSRTNR